MREKPAQSAQRMVVSLRFGPRSSTGPSGSTARVQPTWRLGPFWDDWIISRIGIMSLCVAWRARDSLAAMNRDRGWLRLGGNPHARHHPAMVWIYSSGLGSAFYSGCDRWRRPGEAA